MRKTYLYELVSSQYNFLYVCKSKMKSIQAIKRNPKKTNIKYSYSRVWVKPFGCFWETKTCMYRSEGI